MKFKHFHLALIVRIVFTVLTSGLLVYTLFVSQNYYLSIGLGLVLIILIINLLHFFNTINRWIAFFLLGIENEDTTLRIPQKTGNKTIDEVFNGMNRLNEIFQKTKIDINTQEQYFKSLINQSVTGLLSINNKGRIININPAAEKLTGLVNFQHLSALGRIHNDIPEFISQPQTENESVSAIFENPRGQKLLFKLTEISTNDDTLKLVAVSDITKELDTSEVDAWVKLARTLAHEIMNNITPITTLSQVILNYFKPNQKALTAQEVTESVIANTIKGIEVIEERSAGLLHFVENYRKFTKLPEPHLKRVDITALMQHILVAFGTYPGYDKISVDTHIMENIHGKTDENLLSQVVLNLLKNSLEALLEEQSAEELKIQIHLDQSDHQIHLVISNNGPQIPSELREQIFIPFFTTKEEGSGIGLSLSKQIMIKLGGDINLMKQQEKWTHFQVTLPAI